MIKTVLSIFMTCFCLQVTAHEAELPLYFWDARATQGFSNFGDALSEALTERILGHKVRVVESPICNERKLLGMGSILNYAQENDVIWGTGVNGKTPMSAYAFTNLDVRAVRGPLTRKFLLDRGIACPEVYGDPTLLLPLLFPEFTKNPNPSKEYIVIPHYSDEPLFLSEFSTVSVKEPWDQVVNKILDSKFVISSALSGVIVAEAFGISARLLIIENANNTENLFKYQDYYFGTNRFDFKYATTVEEALKIGGEPLPQCDLKKLYEAFPFEFFNIESFSSYTEGLYTVTHIFEDSDTVDITVRLPQKFQQKIQKKVISLNGVKAQIKEIKLEKNEIDQIQVIARISKKIFLNSSLIHLHTGSKISLGMVSSDPDKWLLNGEPIGRVILRDAKIAKEHGYLEEFIFECSQDQYQQIRHLKYIGLDGSGFIIQRIEEQDKRYYLSVHAGRLTREKTIFNRNTIAIGTECTLSLPFKSYVRIDN